jgi:hypothetical protein
VRYAALNHPGDSYANSILSQVAKAIRAPTGNDPMDGLAVQRVLAAGQSQSATRLRSYVMSEQARAGVIDGFLVHGDFPPNKSFGELSVPVIQLLADSEASPASPGQTHNYRLWEVAGAAHSDLWIGSSQVFGQGPRMAGAPKRSAADARDLDALADYYGQLRERTIEALDAGFMLRADAEDLLERACAMRSRWLDVLPSEACEGLPDPSTPAPGKSGERPPPHASPGGRPPR